jgi:Xaa-Pro aminopeptidase
MALMDQLGSGVVLVRGAAKPAHMATFYQDHEFFYLTGINEPDLAMLLFPEDKKDLLLVPPFSRFTAKWDGSRLAPGEKAAKLTRFDEVGNSRNLLDRLEKLLAKDADGKRPVLWTLLSPSPGRTATINSVSGALRARANDPLDGRKGREATLADQLQKHFPGLEIKDIAPRLNEMRGIKSPEEIAQVTAATEAAVQGIAEAMKSTEPGMYEFQIAAVARYVFSRLGAGPDAYAAIVGAGLNGCILHYNANNSQVKDGDLIVMDYGATVHGYATDVTRTFPANGKFTAAQRKLVSDVHEVQAALLAKIRPGASLRDLSRSCSKMLMAKGYRVDHGPCHHVGLAVHDMGPDQLEPGMILTVEPGAYLEKEAMGCRIEDTILVTAEGYINLSGALPSTPDGIEALMKLPGIAQQPIGVPEEKR